MTVLVTGAGLIGTHAAKALLDQGSGAVLYDPDPSRAYIDSVVGRDRQLLYVERGDIRDFPHLMDLILRRGVTRILHTAALVGPRADENPSLAFQVNVAGTLNLIEAARIRSLARIVFVSSASVYLVREAPPAAGPLPEAIPYGVPGSFYGAYKAMAEIMTLAYHRQAGVNAIVCRPCGVYGRGGYIGGAAVGRALNDLLLQGIHASPGTELQVQIPTAERLYVKDAALAIREAVFVEKPSTRVYNIGSGEVVTAQSLAAAITEALPEIRTVSVASAEAPVQLLDTTLARQELKYAPQWPLARAIPDYVDELRTYGAYSNQ